MCVFLLINKAKAFFSACSFCPLSQSSHRLPWWPFIGYWITQRTLYFDATDLWPSQHWSGLYRRVWMYERKIDLKDIILVFSRCRRRVNSTMRLLWIDKQKKCFTVKWRGKRDKTRVREEKFKRQVQHLKWGWREPKCGLLKLPLRPTSVSRASAQPRAVGGWTATAAWTLPGWSWKVWKKAARLELKC